MSDTVPIHFTLNADQQGSSCSFTAHVPIVRPPQLRERLLFTFPLQEEPYQRGTLITDVCHFTTEPPTILYLTAPLQFDNNDELLHALDYFKATYQTENFSGNTQPASYYLFYRLLVNLLGLAGEARPYLTYDPLAIKIVAEACRSIIITEHTERDQPLQAAFLTTCVQSFHTMVSQQRVYDPDKADLLAVVKRWEATINIHKWQWKVPVAACVTTAKLVYARLPSIPPDRLPPGVRP